MNGSFSEESLLAIKQMLYAEAAAQPAPQPCKPKKPEVQKAPQPPQTQAAPQAPNPQPAQPPQPQTPAQKKPPCTNTPATPAPGG
jgi:hypothetical protein